MLENKIKFISPLKGFIPEPKPSSFYIPKEYKKSPSYLSTSYQDPTIKKCMPFLDVYMTGYIIPFPVDIEYVVKSEHEKYFTINNSISPEITPLLKVDSHDSSQVPSNLRNPKRSIDKIFKFLNPWTIKTPPGYSCYFMSPSNHVLPFDLISGIVDTDNFTLPIHFPFYWTAPHDKGFILKGGSPMVTVIPFKRERWKMETGYIDTGKLSFKKTYFLTLGTKIFDNYKSKFWRKKSYK